jgi:hypothetical protein
MTDELEGIWKEAVVVQARYYDGISLQGLGKTTKPIKPEQPVYRQRFEPSTSRTQA